jgi:hypothetical protein
VLLILIATLELLIVVASTALLAAYTQKMSPEIIEPPLHLRLSYHRLLVDDHVVVYVLNMLAIGFNSARIYPYYPVALLSCNERTEQLLYTRAVPPSPRVQAFGQYLYHRVSCH